MLPLQSTPCKPEYRNWSVRHCRIGRESADLISHCPTGNSQEVDEELASSVKTLEVGVKPPQAVLSGRR